MLGEGYLERLLLRGVGRETAVELDGREYGVRIVRQVSLGPDAPRLVVVAYQPNRTARRVLDVCIRTIEAYTPVPHELWIVDNDSPAWWARRLASRPGVNVVLNRTQPLPAGADGTGAEESQIDHGSYANAVGLELAAQLVDPEAAYFMALHMDVAPCSPRWLPFLLSKLRDNVAAAGVRFDRARTPEGVLHVLGYVVDFQLLRRLGLDFFPALPDHDVGDRVTIGLRQAGYDVFACHNTLWEPELAAGIPAGSPLRELKVDRSFDDDGNVIFLHLGRGVRKSVRLHTRGTMTAAWLDFAERHLLAGNG